MTSTTQIATPVTGFVHGTVVNVRRGLRDVSGRLDPDGGHDVVEFPGLTGREGVVDIIIPGTFDVDAGDVTALLGLGGHEGGHAVRTDVLVLDVYLVELEFVAARVVLLDGGDEGLWEVEGRDPEDVGRAGLLPGLQELDALDEVQQPVAERFGAQLAEAVLVRPGFGHAVDADVERHVLHLLGHDDGAFLGAHEDCQVLVDFLDEDVELLGLLGQH